ncbi:MAG: transaldolase family protein [Bacilli bacterium]
MALFIDTANRDEAYRALATGLVQGITTNPTLLAREGKNAVDSIQRLCDLNPEALCVQLTGSTVLEMETQIAAWKSKLPQSDNVVYKVPPTWSALQVVRRFSPETQFLVTAVNTVSQTLCASLAGAAYVAVYISRYLSRHDNQFPPTRNMVTACGSKTRVMVASCHSHAEIDMALETGVQDLTLSPKIFWSLLEDDGTAEDLSSFARDALSLSFE